MFKLNNGESNEKKEKKQNVWYFFCQMFCITLDTYREIILFIISNYGYQITVNDMKHIYSNFHGWI